MRGSTSNTKLKLDKHHLRGVPMCPDLGMPSLKFDPQAFVIESPRLESKIIEASVQHRSLELFQAKPTMAMTYLVAATPDDSKAKYFAAYLVSLHNAFLGLKAEVAWDHVYSGFDNPLLKREADPTLIVLDNLTVRSSNLKFEKVRDVIERYPRIPKIVVCVGEDPISFASTRLHVAAHGIAYFPSQRVKTAQVVI